MKKIQLITCKEWMVWVLALVGGADCVVIPILFSLQADPLFPLPGFYMVEIMLLGLVGVYSSVLETQPATRWRVMPWITAGVLLSFVVLGAWSIGFFLSPGFAAFILIGTLKNKRAKEEFKKHLAIFFAVLLLQSAIILTFAFLV